MPFLHRRETCMDKFGNPRDIRPSCLFFTDTNLRTKLAHPDISDLQAFVHTIQICGYETGTSKRYYKLMPFHHRIQTPFYEYKPPPPPIY